MEPIEKNNEFGKCYTEQNDVENVNDLSDKNVKILPAHVEELKCQVSLYGIFF